VMMLLFTVSLRGQFKVPAERGAGQVLRELREEQGSGARGSAAEKNAGGLRRGGRRHMSFAQEKAEPGARPLHFISPDKENDAAALKAYAATGRRTS